MLPEAGDGASQQEEAEKGEQEMKTAKLSAKSPDIEVKHAELPAECWVYRPNARTLRVTLWTSIPGQSRMFEITKSHIREIED